MTFPLPSSLRNGQDNLGGRLEVAAPILIQEYRPALSYTPDRESGGNIAMPAEVTNDVAASGYILVVNGMASRNHIQLPQAGVAGGFSTSLAASDIILAERV